MYKEFSFKKLENARHKAKEMKEAFGYTPSVFRVKHPTTGNIKYVVIKPKGLKRM